MISCILLITGKLPGKDRKLYSIKNTAILIPSFKPDSSFVDLAAQLKKQGYGLLLAVDDGSGPEYSDIFARIKKLGFEIIRHSANRGKGTALKTGFKYILENRKDIDYTVTADADGQHLPKDILKISRAVQDKTGTIIIGSRSFDKSVPARSRFGNIITRSVFRIVAGYKINDTQSGLRAIPSAALNDLLTLNGSRYDYEMNILLEAKHLGLKIEEVKINVIYLENNSSSHFRPLIDSWRIYRLILGFGVSALLAYLIDYSIFILLRIIWPEQIAVSVSAAKLISSVANFSMNRKLLTLKKKKGSSLKKQISRYYLLAGINIIVNYTIIKCLVYLGLNVYFAKVIADTMLFFINFMVQRHLIF